MNHTQSQQLQNDDLPSSNNVKQSGFLAQFVEHPASVGETYWQHMAFALRFSGTLFCAAFAALVHAAIPPLFETTAGRLINSMYETMQNRHNHS